MNPLNSLTANEKRNEYKQYLIDEYKNELKNLKANQLYHLTGEPALPPRDLRTADERLADIQNVKRMVYSGLLSITDGINANEIVQELSPDDLQLVAGALPKIIEILKPIYSLGVPKDIFLNWLDTFKQKLGKKSIPPINDSNISDSDSQSDDEEELASVDIPPQIQKEEILSVEEFAKLKKTND